MLAYILGITKRGNKVITNREKFLELQIGARGLTNTGSLRDFKLGQKDYKSGQRFQIGANRFQIGAEIINRGRTLVTARYVILLFLLTNLLIIESFYYLQSNEIFYLQSK